MIPGFSLNGKTLQFTAGLPQDFNGPHLPGGSAQHSGGSWGGLVIQEAFTENWKTRCFDFFPEDDLLLTTSEEAGLQSLVAVNGSFDYRLDDALNIRLEEKEFCMLSTPALSSNLFLRRGKKITIWNTLYRPSFYQRFLHLFPMLQQLSQWTKTFLLTPHPKPARFTVHDAIASIFYDRYLPELEKIYMHLRLESSFFSMMAAAEQKTTGTLQDAPQQRQLAASARQLVISHPKQNFTLNSMAGQLHCSASTLKRYFLKIYGATFHDFSKEYKMMQAKERLLNNERLKVVAIDLGFNPLTFPKEFKRFFGYTISQMKKGLH
jgi:AraC-like DNA-binding protein